MRCQLYKSPVFAAACALLRGRAVATSHAPPACAGMSVRSSRLLCAFRSPRLGLLQTLSDVAREGGFKCVRFSCLNMPPRSALLRRSGSLMVYRSSHCRALFSGVGPRALRAAPACGITLACYEGVLHWHRAQLLSVGDPHCFDLR